MANAIISNSTQENNSTLLNGSNGRGFGGAIASIGSTNRTVTGLTISGNASYSGGAIYVGSSTSVNNVFAGLTVIDTSITNNQATTEAGGITQRTGSTQIERSSTVSSLGRFRGTSNSARPVLKPSVR